MSFRDYFSALAEQYAEYRPTYPPALFDYLASISPVRALAWDCATGNGQAAHELARHFQRVIATDASAEQIANAFPHERVTYRVEPAERTTIAANTVDLTTVGTAVHWFDFDAFYDEVRRISKPRAILAVWTYHFPVINPAVDSFLQQLYWDTLGGYWPEELRYLEKHYRTIPFPFTEIKPPPFAIEAEWNVEQFIGFIASWSATHRYMEERGQEALEASIARLRTIWGAPDRQHPVRWPLHFRLGRLPG
ncbi:MAG: class I SAM-dependent methyltransferase [Chloroflexota bacterium]